MNIKEIHKKIENRLEELNLNGEHICGSAELEAYYGEGELELIYDWNLEDAIENNEVHHYELIVGVESYSHEGDAQKLKLIDQFKEWFEEFNLEIENEWKRFSNYNYDRVSREATFFRLIAA